MLPRVVERIQAGPGRKEKITVSPADTEMAGAIDLPVVALVILSMRHGPVISSRHWKREPGDMSTVVMGDCVRLAS